jgi:hypothetical protein
MMQRAALAFVVALALSGCVTRTVYIVPELPVPPAPVLPTVQAEELSCLSDAAYESLAVRDALRKAYADQLVAILEEHNRRAE